VQGEVGGVVQQHVPGLVGQRPDGLGGVDVGPDPHRAGGAHVWDISLRDNPRVPWALRDLCNPWTWAYSLDPSRLQYLKLSHYS